MCIARNPDCWSLRSIRNDVERAGASMIDHISVGVSDLERSARFYEATLAPLGLVAAGDAAGDGRLRQDLSRVLDQFARRHGAGRAGKRRPYLPSRASPPPMSMRFTRRRCSAGGRSDGAPGLRPHDRVKYYAAFVVDPDGNRIEAVTFPKDDARLDRLTACSPVPAPFPCALPARARRRRAGAAGYPRPVRPSEYRPAGWAG